MFMAAVLGATMLSGCGDRATPRVTDSGKGGGIGNDAGSRGADRKSSQPATNDPQEKSGRRSKPNELPAEKGSSGPPPIGPTAIPAVYLTEQHEKVCKVNVGDSLPAMQLTDLAGESVEDIRPLLGKKATVVIFWTDAVVQLEHVQDIRGDVADSFAAAGVRIVAIHVGGAADVVRQSTADLADPALSVLLDSSGAALARVVSGESPSMPRTYVLDAEGKIRWFDIEVSRAARRDLARTLRFLTRP